MTAPSTPYLTLDGLTLLFRLDGAGPYWVDPAGTEWILTKFDGWSGAPAPRTMRADRPGHPGSFRSAAYRGTKVLGLEFVATALDQPGMRLVEQQVAAVCSDPARLYDLVVTEGVTSRTVAVELDDAVIITPRTWCSSLFTLRLAAPDPRKHDTGWQSPIGSMGTAPIGGADFSGGGLMFATTPGVDFGTPGSPAPVSVRNAGTAVARPFFAVSGPLPSGWQIVDLTNGTTLTYTRALGPTDVLVINCDEFPVQGFPARGVYLNTSNNQRPALLVSNGWPRVLPGQSVTYNLRAPTFAGGSITASLRSAWH